MLNKLTGEKGSFPMICVNKVSDHNVEILVSKEAVDPLLRARELWLEDKSLKKITSPRCHHKTGEFAVLVAG